MEAVLETGSREEQRESAPARRNPTGEVCASDRERSADRPFARGAGSGGIHAAGTGGRRFSREVGAAAARSGRMGARGRGAGRGTVSEAFRSEGVRLAGESARARSAVLWRAPSLARAAGSGPFSRISGAPVRVVAFAGARADPPVLGGMRIRGGEPAGAH